MQVKKALVWMLLTESMLILATRLGTFLHEFAGHGLLAMLFGGRFESFRLTLFAGGDAQFSGHFGKTATIVISLGGILVNLITGLIALRQVRTRRMSFSLTLFCLLLAGVSILSQLQYLILGAYYQYSDLAFLSDYHPAILFLVWTLGFVALACFSFFIMSVFFHFQEAYFPSSHVFKRASIAFLILGIPVLLYAGFYHLGKTPLGSTAAIMEACLQAEKEAERIKTETGSTQSLDEIRKGLEPRPLLPWIIAIYVLSTLAALFWPASRITPKDCFPPLPSSFLSILPWLIAGGSTLALIALLW
ncbi:MAG: M50 family metallopeptidase [bacterium]